MLIERAMVKGRALLQAWILNLPSVHVNQAWKSHMTFRKKAHRWVVVSTGLPLTNIDYLRSQVPPQPKC